MANGTGAGGGSSFGFNTSFSDLNTGLFGQSSTSSSSGTTKEGGVSEERITFNRDNLIALVDRALQKGGVGEPFGEEDIAGIFNSSVAKQASGDIIAQIVGELASLTGVKRTGFTKEGESTQESTTESPGLLENLPIVGGLF